MNQSPLASDSYKGVRDFYPTDYAVQRFIFERWAEVAESFGYERYDASLLEPADLYRAKGSQNDEMVNEQTYTFTDRGDREVTLRPEMTPTVARMIAKARRELTFPLRWYSIPNLFRYERPQRGRLREHWQLNCDLFGVSDFSADVEIILLAHQLFQAFGATPDLYRIRVNHRGALNRSLAAAGISDEATVRAVLGVIDRKDKLTPEAFTAALAEATAGQPYSLPTEMPEEVRHLIGGLIALGLTNVEYDPGIVRGFSYYTGMVFEVSDTSPENPRALMGGGRYDNLTALFGGEPVTGVGFGIGDVTMRDFLETHNLLPPAVRVTAPTVMFLPLSVEFNLACFALATSLRRDARVSVATDISDKKIGKKIKDASDRGCEYVIVVGEDELVGQNFTLRALATGEEIAGPLDRLVEALLAR